MKTKEEQRAKAELVEIIRAAFALVAQADARRKERGR
jgi:hypothetical protein